MDDINFFDIIANVPSNDDEIAGYFERKMKMAERDLFYNPEDFINGLRGVIKDDAAKKRSYLENEIKTAFGYGHKMSYNLRTDVLDNETYDEYHARRVAVEIEGYKSQLEEVSRDESKLLAGIDSLQGKINDLGNHPMADSPAKDNNEEEKYTVDNGLVRVIFSFCKERNILRDEITELKLMIRFAKADFSGDICTAGNKLKIQIIIHAVVTEMMMGAKTDDWYSDAVESLGITKPNCSKNHSPKFKEDLICAIKEYKSQRKIIPTQW